MRTTSVMLAVLCPPRFLSGRARRCHFMPYDYSRPHVSLNERPRSYTLAQLLGEVTESSRSAAFSVQLFFCVLLRTHLQAKF